MLFPNSWIRIGLAAKHKGILFNNLLCHFNMENFREAFDDLSGNKALGIDGMNKKQYGKNLEANLMDLIERIHEGSYKPHNKREKLIPKANGKMRPIAISCFEDKIVEWVIGKVLECIYEPIFIRNSFGFRPNKSADGAIKAIYHSLKRNKRSQIVEIDFASFFNSISHKKLMKTLDLRISDNRFKGLVGRFLKVGILEETGNLKLPETGTPQGSVMSPILANIYLHEVIDKWFIENYASYKNVIVRYADDAVFFFKNKDTADEFVTELFERVNSFGLSLNDDKTRIISFDKNANSSFDFLGFTFYWANKYATKTKILKLKTNKKSLHKKIEDFKDWIKTNRSKLKTRELWIKTKEKLVGHYNYFGYYLNSQKLWQYYKEIIKILFKWLNRRSQKISYDYEGFKSMIEFYKIPVPPATDKLKQLGWSPYLC